MNELSYKLPPNLSTAVQQVLDDWQTTGRMERLWGRDAAIWTGGDEAHWLGWLTIAFVVLLILGFWILKHV